MAREQSFDPKYIKTYANRANLEKAVNKVEWLKDARYVVLTTDDGRVYPVFLWNERSCDWMAIWVVQLGWAVMN